MPTCAASRRFRKPITTRSGPIWSKAGRERRRLPGLCPGHAGRRRSPRPAPTRCCARGSTGPAPGSPISTHCAPNGTQGAPVVPIVFYRALVQGAGLHPINRLTRALLRKGLNPMPVFVASLKDPVSVATLDHLFTQAPPAVILNCTSFAVGSPHDGDDSPANPLAVPWPMTRRSSRSFWPRRPRRPGPALPDGLSARDIAMNVALPEVDGRILSRARSASRGEAYLRRGHRMRHRHLSRAGRPDRFRRRPRRELGKAARHPGQRAQGRADPRQLSQQGRATRQWRRPRHPRRHGPHAGPAGEAGYAVETPPADARRADGADHGRPDQLADRPRATATAALPCRLQPTASITASFPTTCARRSRIAGASPKPTPSLSQKYPRRRQTPKAASSCRS